MYTQSQDLGQLMNTEMKATKHPGNLPQYQLLTEKYKVSHKKSQESGSFKMLPHQNTHPVSRTKHAHANESDSEMNSTSEGYSGESNKGQNEYVVEEDDAEVRPKRSRGRLQLRLKKVKRYETNITIEKCSKSSVRAQERHTKYGSLETFRKDKHQCLEKFSKRDKHDLVCVYDLNDNEVHCEKYNEKIVLVKKYKTAAGEAVYERLVRPSHRRKKINRQKSDNRYKAGRSDLLYKDSCGYKEKTSGVELYKYKDADGDKGSGQIQSTWSRSEEDENMSSNESESEFEVEEKQNFCKRFRRVGYRHSRTSTQKSQCDQSETCLKEMDEHEASLDTDVERISVKEHSEDIIGMFHCVFCLKSFTSDEALDNHYMTHFTTVHGLNSFLKKQHQKKHSELKRIPSSLTKYSKSYDSRVTMKVAVDIDVDEGVDCTSPGTYSCEIIELQEPELKLPECMKESQQRSDNEEVPKTEEVQQKEVSETSSELKLRTPNAEEYHCLAGSRKDDTCLISSGSQSLYCSHNLELAKSCMKRVVKVALKPLKDENDKFIKKSDLSEDLMMEQVQNSLKGVRCLKDRSRYENSVKHNVQKESKDSQKISLLECMNYSKKEGDRSNEKVRNREIKLTGSPNSISEQEQEIHYIFDAPELKSHNERKVNMPAFEISNSNVSSNQLSSNHDIKSLKATESFEQVSEELDDILNLKFHGEIESENRKNDAEIDSVTSEIKAEESYIELNNNDDINCQQIIEIESKLHKSALKLEKEETKKENFNGISTCEKKLSTVDQPIKSSEIVYTIKTDKVSSQTDDYAQDLDTYWKFKKNKHSRSRRYCNTKSMTQMKNRQTVNELGSSTDENNLLDKKGLIMLEKTDKMLINVNEKNEKKTENVDCKVDVGEKLELLQKNKVSPKNHFEKLDKENFARKEYDLSVSNINRFTVPERSTCSDQKQLNDHSVTENNFHLQYKTLDVFNVEAGNENRKSSEYDFSHGMPENRDDKRFLDSCCEDMLIEFASDLDIVLNSPDNSVMIFDENALYKNLENLNSKEILCNENNTTAESECTELIVDNAQVPSDFRELESDYFSQLSVNDRDSLKKSCSQKSNKLRSFVSLPQVSPDAISACMAITGLQPQKYKLENEKGTCNLNDEVSDLNSSQHIQRKKLGVINDFQAAEDYEEDMSSSCDGKRDGKIDSRMRIGSHEVTCQYGDPREIPQNLEINWLTNQAAHSVNSEHGKTHFGYNQMVWMAGRDSFQDGMPVVQCTEATKVKGDVCYKKGEILRQPDKHTESEKVDLDTKFNLPALSCEDVSVVLEKNSRSHEKNLNSMFKGWSEEGDSLKKIENGQAEIDIQNVGRNRHDKESNEEHVNHGKQIIKETNKHDKQTNKEINIHDEQNTKVINSQLNPSYTSELSDVLIERGKGYSSSKLRKRIHNNCIESHEQTKFEKGGDVNNNLDDVVNFTNTEGKKKDLQVSDETVHRNDDVKPKTTMQWSGMKNDEVEKVRHFPLKRFYRCEKCNKLFHAVSTLDFSNYNNYKKGDEVVSEKRSILCDKHSADAKPNIRDESIKVKVSKVKSKTNVEMDTETPLYVIPKNRCKSIPKNIAGTEQNLRDSIKGSPEQVGEQISLKLVLQKVKNPAVSAGRNKRKVTISPWKVRDIQTSEPIAKDFIEHPTENVSSNENTIKSNNVMAGETHVEQILENLDIENSTSKIKESCSEDEMKESNSEAVEKKGESEKENLTDSLSDVSAENLEREKTSEHVDADVKHVKPDSLRETRNSLKKVNVKMRHSATKTDCSEELNEFEKALLKGNIEKKKDKVKKKNKQRDGIQTVSRQDSGEKVYTEDNKTLLFRRRKSNNSSVNSKSMQPFQKSKMAQMIYSKHQKEHSKFKSQDGLPDFSATKVKLDGLLPLSVSSRQLDCPSPKPSNKNSGTCCKISEGKSSSGANEVTKPITNGIKDVSVSSCISSISSASNVEAAITLTAVLNDSSDCNNIRVNSHSCFKDENEKKLKGVNGNQTLKTHVLGSIDAKTKVVRDYDRKNFKRLKKELEAIGIQKNENMTEKVGSNYDGVFSSPWNSQMTDTDMNKFQPVLPSFSDTFSKKRLWPTEKNKFFPNITSFSIIPEIGSNKVSETFSCFNDEKLTEVGLNKNILDEVEKSSEEESMTIFHKRCEQNELDDCKPAGLLMPCSAELDSNSSHLSPMAIRMKSEFSHMKLDTSTMNFSSTPAVKRSFMSMSATPCSELNISQFCSSSPIQDQYSDLLSSRKRRIKRYEVQGLQSDGNESQRNETILQDSALSSMLILSADCSKIDMTDLSGPSVDHDVENSLNENIAYDAFDDEISLMQNVQSKTMKKGSIFNQAQTQGVKRNVKPVSVRLQEFKSNDRSNKRPDERTNERSREGASRSVNETLLDYEEDYSNGSLYSGNTSTVVCSKGVLNLPEVSDIQNQSESPVIKKCTSELDSLWSPPAFSRKTDVGVESDSSLIEEQPYSEQDSGINISVKSVKDESEKIEVDSDCGEDNTITGTKTEAEGTDKEKIEVKGEADGDDELMNDVLDIYASDEEASFLLDSPSLDIPTKNWCEGSAVKADKTCEVEDMELESESLDAESTAVKAKCNVVGQTISPHQNVSQPQRCVPQPNVSQPQRCVSQLNVSVYRPLRSNPIKGRWMPKGWCYRYFSRNTCNPQCVFRHDNPTEDVLRRCISEITDKCRKGELDSAMNMLMSQQYFMENLSENDLDCLYGYSVNNLKMEYCHTLLQIMSSRDLIKQGHIDDIILLWKRLGYSKDIEALKDVFFMVKQKTIYPQQMAALILIEAFSAFGDMYILWDLITYCTQNGDLVISQQYINNAVTMVTYCQEISLLSEVVSWLEQATCEQLYHISSEVLQRLQKTLQQMNLVKLVSSVEQCVLRKKQMSTGAGLSSLSEHPGHQLSHTPSYSMSDCNSPTLKQMVTKPSNVWAGSRAGTQFNSDGANVRLYSGPNRTSYTSSGLTQPKTEPGTCLDLDSDVQTEHQHLPQSRDDNSPLVSSKGLGQQESIRDNSNLENLANLFIHSTQSGPPPQSVFEQVLFTITKDDNNIAESLEDFILHIKQKLSRNPGLRLDRTSLSAVSSEVFYFCHQTGLQDTKDVLLLILDTEFLSLSWLVGQRWNTCLEIIAAELLLSNGMPERTAQILIGISSKQRLDAEMKTRFLSFLQPLTQQLCAQGQHTLAYQIFCLAFRWKHRGLHRIASEVIQTCIQDRVLSIPTQIYELYVAEGRQFDIQEEAKRSMLIAFFDTKPEYSRNLYQDIIHNTSTSSLYLQQSFKKPRCVWLLSIHTNSEIKVIIWQYLRDLYILLCEQVGRNIPLVEQDLSLDVAIDTQVVAIPNQIKVPYIGQGKATVSSVKQLLFNEFGIESTLTCKGIIKLSVQQTSLESYMKALDEQGRRKLKLPGRNVTVCRICHYLNNSISEGKLGLDFG